MESMLNKMTVETISEEEKRPYLKEKVKSLMTQYCISKSSVDVTYEEFESWIEEFQVLNIFLRFL